MKSVALDDKYTATSGHIYLTGTQALVRLPMTQMRRDRAAGLNTAAFISGYRGSPLGNYDLQLQQAKQFLDPLDVTFQPGLNEDLAATAVWGSQQVGLSDNPSRDGVLGLWYGKGPGVDRSGDAFKHGNAAGTSRHGGVLAFAGDDHTAKSSSIPHQSDHAFISAVMPVLYPSSIHEFLEIGLLGIAMSRYSGCWVGFKVISETVETTSVVDLSQEQRQFVLPEDFELPAGGLNLRWPDPPLVQDERLQEYKAYAAIAFGRANRIDEVTIDTPHARFGIVASGKAYEDVRQALIELGITDSEARAIGLRLYKVRMPWPLEPEGIRHFSQGLEEVLIVEERREIIENQIKQQLFNWRYDVRPKIVGKFDHEDKPFLSLSRGLTVSAVARAIADRILQLALPDGLKEQIEGNLERLEALQQRREKHLAPVIRLPHYCAGCPHNTSTRVPDGSKAMAGIGCHYMVQWMDRNTETFTHMGAEGVPWTAINRYSDEKHRFVNLGDGTYFHSGILAVRQSVAAQATITYKILYNDAVAMTGGQDLDGQLTPEQLTHQLYHERVRKIYLLSDNPQAYSRSRLAPGVVVRHRDHIDQVMLEVRDIPGTTAIIYEQTCAAEKRRRRKRGLLEDPDRRVFINTAVCEGCGDCSEQSNCIAIEPVETEFGRKRRINQSSCNKDYSCVKGFCPSFVSIRGGRIRKPAAFEAPDISVLPDPARPALQRPWNIAVTGVGGTGVLTIGALLGMAAHIEGKSPLIMDMAGLAQKGGAVLSHIRLSTRDNPAMAPRIANGSADVLIAADAVVASSQDGITICDSQRTQAILNSRVVPVSDFVRDGDFDFQKAQVEDVIRDNVMGGRHFHDFTAAALGLVGDEIAANIMMLGYSWQQGLIPLEAASIEQAISVNGVAVEANRAAFAWGRIMAQDVDQVKTRIQTEQPRTVAQLSLDELIANRKEHLVAYQDQQLADRYIALLERVKSQVVDRLSSSECNSLVRVVAECYAKVLAYKDEYEVARLYGTTEFRESLAKQFEGDFRLSLHMAPPFLPGKSPDGRPLKREFGSWMLKVMPQLARMKKFRGTRWDVFGRSEERQAERALIIQYEQDVNFVLTELREDNLNKAIRLLNLPHRVRGFGPVKAQSMKDVNNEREALIASFHGDAQAVEIHLPEVAQR